VPPDVSRRQRATKFASIAVSYRWVVACTLDGRAILPVFPTRGPSLGISHHDA